jgi:hypothetical protein
MLLRLQPAAAALGRLLCLPEPFERSLRSRTLAGSTWPSCEAFDSFDASAASCRQFTGSTSSVAPLNTLVTSAIRSDRDIPLSSESPAISASMRAIARSVVVAASNFLERILESVEFSYTDSDDSSAPTTAAHCPVGVASRSFGQPARSPGRIRWPRGHPGAANTGPRTGRRIGTAR